ncbi:cell division protein DedD [Shewanella sp. SNU WT4]|uniref:cell division protein DedD n=1 Tax=Shewanella sp. SNU WT4 TaxID=2590015 RepID=UPI00112D7FA2|nr:cell division protein DedD [Shewanella sp. SNU WT4]QDF67507.1 cell division protein DedD [Shewanella sp. SNU WT4]
MSTQFHNRLVGIIVLVALGVIFLPDMLDGKPLQEQETFAEIPLRPKTQTPPATFEVASIAPVDLSQAPVQSSLEGKTESAAKVEPKPEVKPEPKPEVKSEAKAQPKPEPKPQPKVEPKPEAKPKPKPETQTASISAKAGWTLQLGSFANANNVNALVAQLRKAGFPTYTYPAKPVDGQLTKVFVGPEINKDKLSGMQARVHKLTDLKGRIVNYDPIQG